MPSGQLITCFQHNSFSGSVSIMLRTAAHVQQSRAQVSYAAFLIQVLDFKKLSPQISLATGYGEFNPASQGGSIATTSSILEAWGKQSACQLSFYGTSWWHHTAVGQRRSTLQVYTLLDELFLQIHHCAVNNDVVYTQHVLSELCASVVWIEDSDIIFSPIFLQRPNKMIYINKLKQTPSK